MKKNVLMSKLALAAVLFFSACAAFAAEEGTETAEAVKKTPSNAIYYAIAITMSVGSLAAGFAVGKVGSAAMGAAAEKPELLGKAIPFVGLGEGIALFGFLISLFLVFKL